MSKQPSTIAPANYGIQATNVTSTVTIAGPNSKATLNQYYSGSEISQVVDAVLHLQNGLDGLNLSSTQKGSLDSEVAGIETAMRKSPQDTEEGQKHLRALVSKVEKTGKIIKDVAELVGPLTTLAQLLKVPLHMVGL